MGKREVRSGRRYGAGKKVRMKSWVLVGGPLMEMRDEGCRRDKRWEMFI